MPPRTRQRATDQRKALGRRIRAYRLALGLTSRDLAAHIGSSHTAMTRVETCSQDVVSGTLILVAEAVGLRVVLAAPHHLPLLDLTADEINALIRAAGVKLAFHGTDDQHLTSALDKLTTTEEPPNA